MSQGGEKAVDVSLLSLDDLFFGCSPLFGQLLYREPTSAKLLDSLDEHDVVLVQQAEHQVLPLLERLVMKQGGQ